MAFHQKRHLNPEILRKKMIKDPDLTLKHILHSQATPNPLLAFSFFV
jgi:hypothetical protein